jgi:pheromone shutdown-related protein TraB
MSDEAIQAPLESLRRLQLGEREFLLLGTAHISSRSVEEVRALILEEKPDRVCVELDAARYGSLTEGSGWGKLDIVEVLKKGKGFLLLANLVLSSFQRRLGVGLGVNPGEEMLTAVRLAQEAGIPFSLCDRDIQLTLRRAWARTSFWGKNKMLAAMLASIFSSEKLSAEEIEKLKSRTTFQSMLDELAGYLPAVKEVLIDERDRYLATRIFQSEGRRVVAVVGAGHVEGIARSLQDLEAGKLEADTRALEQVPLRRRLGSYLGWLIPAAIVGLLVASLLRMDWQLSLAMLWKWVQLSGALAALGTALTLAHPVTIAAAFIGAPITALNPFIGIGLVTGVLEAFLRKPRVSDFENLHEDLLSFRGFYRNRVTHILLVFLFSSLGAMIGNLIGLPVWLTALLRK